ncbi:hypothetical protein [Dactylosporangium darangshiense]|uniref:hypothetical protein n=1 Tax=Dactylosporangium darangshiense TaxID=579108 RepID=UPI0031F0F587
MQLVGAAVERPTADMPSSSGRSIATSGEFAAETAVANGNPPAELTRGMDLVARLAQSTGPGRSDRPVSARLDRIDHGPGPVELVERPQLLQCRQMQR